MKSKIKHSGIFVLLALLAFSLASCPGTSPCTHTPGAAATCTTAQSCTSCGDVLQAALGHSFDHFVEKTRDCKTCGYTQTSAPPTVWNTIPGGTGTTTITDPGQSTFGANSIVSITYGAGRFVAVGDNGNMAWSNDGIIWNAIPGGGTNPITDPGQSTFGANGIWSITYGAGRFVAGGSNRRIAWSNDGINWTAVDTDTTFPSDINFVIYGASGFIAGGSGLRMAWSDDGKIWRIIDRTNQINIRDITYGDGRYVVVGDLGRIAWSNDGITWNGIYGGTGPGQSTFPGSII